MIIFELLVVAAQIAFLYAAIWCFLFLIAWAMMTAAAWLYGILLYGDAEGWDWLLSPAATVYENACWLGNTIGTVFSQAATVATNTVGSAVATVDSWLPWNWSAPVSEGGTVSGDVINAEGALA